MPDDKKVLPIVRELRFGDVRQRARCRGKTSLAGLGTVPSTASGFFCCSPPVTVEDAIAECQALESQVSVRRISARVCAASAWT